jgi:hypothetical protein
MPMSQVSPQPVRQIAGYFTNYFSYQKARNFRWLILFSKGMGCLFKFKECIPVTKGSNFSIGK